MVSILIEFHGFWAYENREAMAADTGDESSHVWQMNEHRLRHIPGIIHVTICNSIFSKRKHCLMFLWFCTKNLKTVGDRMRNFIK